MVRTIPLVCFLVPSSSHLREAGPVSLSLSWHQSLQQQCGLQPPIFSDHRRRHSRELFASSPGTSATSDAPEDNNDGNLPPATPIVYKYPFFGDIVDTIKSHVTKDRSSMHPGPNATAYILEEGFLQEDRAWIQYVRTERMRKRSEVLYRPQIVNDLVQQIEHLLASGDGVGLLVKGPQGVGKSYSLINLTRYLLANGTYWVTIIPDCERWINEDSFFEFLLQSVGVDPFVLRSKYNPSRLQDYVYLIGDIDSVLAEQGMKWVLIFDQINKIFARPAFQQTKDVTVLPFPFVMMKDILKPERIVSIISASANNDVSHRENHAGFDEFYHPTRFNKEEINLLYPPKQIDKWDWDILDYETGRVPLYLKQWAQDRDTYSSKVGNEIQGSLEKLRREQNDVWESFVKSSIRCLLGLSLTREPRNFDRKFSFVLQSAKKPYNYNITALFPLVKEEYRNFFWEDLFINIRKREGEILSVCRDPATPADVRGRLFEEIVIARLLTEDSFPDDFKRMWNDVDFTFNADIEADLRRPAKKSELSNKKFPEGAYKDNCLTYLVPSVPNFPAVDMFIRLRKIVIAFQFHVSDHADVLPLLMNKTRDAGWTRQQVEKIILVYLSPKVETTTAMKKKITKNLDKQTLPTEGDWVVTRFYSIEDFASLRTINWDF